jgi:cobalamin biosynthesis Mg chelatase CobN
MSDLDDVKEQFQRFALYDDYKHLYNKCVPAIRQFEEQVNQYYKDHKNAKETMRRFDVVITEKANKLDLDELINFVKEHCALKSQQIKFTNENKERFDELADEFDKL